MWGGSWGGGSRFLTPLWGIPRLRYDHFGMHSFESCPPSQLVSNAYQSGPQCVSKRTALEMPRYRGVSDIRPGLYPTTCEDPQNHSVPRHFADTPWSPCQDLGY